MDVETRPPPAAPSVTRRGRCVTASPSLGARWIRRARLVRWIRRARLVELRRGGNPHGNKLSETEVTEPNRGRRNAPDGPAQASRCLDRTQEVAGSSPASSITRDRRGFWLPGPPCQQLEWQHGDNKSSRFLRSCRGDPRARSLLPGFLAATLLVAAAAAVGYFAFDLRIEEAPDDNSATLTEREGRNCLRLTRRSRATALRPASTAPRRLNALPTTPSP
jgi:hypothetical protein